MPLAALMLLPVLITPAGSANAVEHKDAKATVASDSGRMESASSPRAGIRGVSLKPSVRQADQGDRYSVVATIKSPRKALRVTWQKVDQPDYAFQQPEWATLRTTRVKGRSKVKLAAVADEKNADRIRAIVTYKNAKPVTSKAVSITVWRWIPFSEYSPYYEAQRNSAGFGTVQINGNSYAGWGPYYYSHTGSWESRFTPGRHCTAFRGVLGLSDISADGSSGTIALDADGVTVYTSPSLTPGADLPINIHLAKPYRLGIQITDTTPGGTTGRDDAEAWPVIGEPALRCTGVA